MNAEQMLQLIDAVSASNLAEFKYEENGIKLSLKKAGSVAAEPVYVVSSPAAVQPVAVPVANPSEEETENTAEQAEPVKGNVVKSPLVGTFYAAPAEDAEPFVQVGDQVKEGQVLGIVEAMKLMNEIESDFSGTVTEILVSNGQAVEYGQPLFVIC